MLTESYIYRLKELAGIKDTAEEIDEATILTPDRDWFFRGLPLISDIKTKEQIAYYNAVIERINMLYRNNSLNMDITDNIEDTDYFMDHDIDNRWFEEVVEEKMDELDNLTNEELANGEENAIDYLDESEIPLNLSIENLVIQAKGLTDYISDAGYILRDGGLLNFNRSGSGDDHRTLEIPVNEEVSGTKLMYAFMDMTGAIRIDGDRGTIHMRTEPSMAQWKIIEKIILKNRDDFYIDISRKGENITHLRSPMALDMINHKVEQFYA